jgi:DNA-binding transcriptional ArsR family regulator
LDPVFLVDAFEHGADGILVAGCHIGECHYIDGNIQAENKIRLARKLLQETGIGESRLHLSWISAAEGQRFAQVMTDFVQTCTQAGPLDRARHSLKLKALRRTLDRENVRWMLGMEKEICEQGDVYGRSWDQERYEHVLDQVALTEYRKQLICSVLDQGKATVQDVGTRTGLALPEISHLLADLERTGMIETRGVRGNDPQFVSA